MTTNGSLKPFLGLWLAQTLSVLATHAVQFALIWWLTIETGSAMVILVATLVGLAPAIALMPFAGALVDRWNRKTVMLVADGAAAAAALVLALLFVADAVGIVACIAVIGVRGISSVFHGPAMLASTSLLVPARHLTRIQGLNQVVQGGVMIAGAPLGGLLLALLPMEGILLVDVGTALIAMAVLGAMRIPQPARTAGPLKGVGDVWADVRLGFAHLRERAGCLELAGLMGAAQLFISWAGALLPLFVVASLSGTATELAWINSAFGAGVVAGGLALTAWGGFENRAVTAIAGLFVVAASTLAIGLSPSALACGLAAALTGFAMPLVNGPIGALLQTKIAPDYQGRVFSLTGFMSGAAVLGGLLLASPLASWLGVRNWYFIGAALCTLTALLALRSRALLAIDAQPSRAG